LDAMMVTIITNPNTNKKGKYSFITLSTDFGCYSRNILVPFFHVSVVNTAMAATVLTATPSILKPIFIKDIEHITLNTELITTRKIEWTAFHSQLKNWRHSQ